MDDGDEADNVPFDVPREFVSAGMPGIYERTMASAAADEYLSDEMFSALQWDLYDGFVARGLDTQTRESARGRYLDTMRLLYGDDFEFNWRLWAEEYDQAG